VVTRTTFYSETQYQKTKTIIWFSHGKKNSKTTDDVAPPTPEIDNGDSLRESKAANDNSAATASANAKPLKKKPQWSLTANHGRYGYDDYPGLETILIPHETLKAGDACPECLLVDQSGKLSSYDAGVYIVLKGSPIITGTRYVAKGYRCNLCGELYKPVVPAEIKFAPKYSASAVSSIAIYHYYMGLPFKRLESCQKSTGVPLADATQYDKMSELKKQLKPIFDCLVALSINSQLLHYDDTPQPVLSLSQGCATAMVSLYQTHWIYLYYTSQRCAGKEVSQLLESRTSHENLITMTDASNQNQLNDANETLLARLIVAYCLVHGRRKFHELLDDFPEVCGFVVEMIAEVYRHEAHCRNNQLSAQARLKYHQLHSAPVLEALHLYLTNLWQYGTLERNSPLGQAVSYMLRHWPALTRFLHVKGCPLDNSICERAIKVLIRYRKNSLFYRTIEGALCGDIIMSLIQTAVRNNINPFDYLTQLQEYKKEVALNPQGFLPWNYQATLKAMAQTQAA
jgi:transposase